MFDTPLSTVDPESAEVSDVIAEVLKPEPDVESARARVEALAARFPLYPGLS
jgi:glycine hydroxymethyltransferase